MSYVNSENERVSIEYATAPPFEGKPLLVLHDDPPSPVKAMTLLDKGLINWLLKELGELNG